MEIKSFIGMQEYDCGRSKHIPLLNAKGDHDSQICYFLKYASKNLGKKPCTKPRLKNGKWEAFCDEDYYFNTKNRRLDIEVVIFIVKYYLSFVHVFFPCSSMHTLENTKFVGQGFLSIQ